MSVFGGFFFLVFVSKYEYKYFWCVGDAFPIRFTAPEVFQNFTFFTKSDVWSIGILAVEIFTYGEIPYPGNSTFKQTHRSEKKT